MFNFTIEKVADTLINQMNLFDCDIEIAWNDYMHTLIKDKFTLQEILNYIEDMQILDEIEERAKNDDGTRYTLEDVKKYMKDRID